MPLIVDKEAVRKEILMAFERCIEKKPMTKITLRDIAEEAGMSHPKLLHYFESRDDLVVSYLRYTKDYMTEKCKLWFATQGRSRREASQRHYADLCPGALQRRGRGSGQGGVSRVARDHGAVPRGDLRPGGRTP